ncbi:unnamed protein product [Staurois parvus]|uniref:Uncharacterized protein n=1 Tax=Staurois parvus TaxID=386267 RepID=A0ABN9E4W1_9NEOB|nr:unnamed protein product [Staurois parvus]
MTELTFSSLSVIVDPLCPRDTAHCHAGCVPLGACGRAHSGRTSYDALPELDKCAVAVIRL